MKETAKKAREFDRKVSASVLKTSVFPVMEAESDGDGRPVPLTYSAYEDIILPEDYRPTKCEFWRFEDASKSSVASCPWIKY
jgi:hypothetical protein